MGTEKRPFFALCLYLKTDLVGNRQIAASYTLCLSKAYNFVPPKFFCGRAEISIKKKSVLKQKSHV